jgi:O-antigen/teichoic acid export membrane protein
MSLKKQAVSGVKWTSIASIINAVLQLIQLIILTRILNPTDFGLMALVTMVIGFSEMFIDIGVSNAIIYKQEITTKQLSSLYWINIIIGIIFFILLILFAPFISEYYENEKLNPLIQLVAITFLIKPWGQQYMVILQKELNFNKIAKTDVVSKFISFVVIISLAFLNFGVYSLAIGSIVFSIFTTIGYNLYGRSFYKPQLYFKIKDIEDFLKFGLYQMGEKTINYFSSQFDTILIGKLLGIETLGIYNVAKNLVTKPSSIINPIITKVSFPLMAKINNDIIKLKEVFLRMVNYLSMVNFPIYFLLATLAKPVVSLLFGNNWNSTIPIIQILSFTYLLRSIGNPSGSLLLSRGKAKTAFYWNLIIFILYPISVIIGSLWGIIGISWSTLVLQMLLLIPNWKYIVVKTCNATFNDYFRTLKIPTILSLLSIIVPLILVKVISQPIILILMGCSIFFLSYFFILYKINPKIILEIKLIVQNGLNLKK